MLTVSSIVPELLTPHATVTDAKTTSNHTHTTSNQTQEDQTAETYSSRDSTSDVFSRGNQFYPTSPTPNEQSYSTSQWNHGNHYANIPTHIFGQSQHHRPTTSPNHHFTPNNAAHFSSAALTPYALSGHSQSHLTPNPSINPDASMETNQGFAPMDPETILDELSAMFEDSSTSIQ